MKKFLLMLFFTASLFTTQAQPYGNEWITPGQIYYKINVTQDGIYRIPVSLLQSYIPSIIGTQTNLLELFHNGQAVPIYISSTGTSLVDTNYIEFYGERNKGYIDSLFYHSAEEQINPDYSLFTDTSVFFFTINPFSTNPPRMVMQAYNLVNHPAADNYFMYKSIVSLHNMYFDGKYYSSGGTELYKSTYDPGEGYTSNVYFNNSSSQTYTISTPAIYTQGPVTTATFKTYYANNSGDNIQYHRVRINLNNIQMPYTPTDTNWFRFNRPTITLPLSQLVSGNNSITYQDQGTSISLQQNVVGYLEMEYPRQFDFGGLKTFFFKLAADVSNRKYLVINNFYSNNTQPLLYDFTNRKIYRSILPAGTSPLQFQIDSSGERNMYLRSDDSYTTITNLTSVTFPTYLPSDYYIITNKNLMDDGNGNHPVEDYQAYRSAKFPNCQVADIDILYDQFAYGIRKSPLAIRNFVSYAKNTFGLKYVFLIGKGRESYTMRTDPNGAYKQCLVPTFGYPGSDNLLTATRFNDTALVAIGRLPAGYRFQVSDYLAKMQKYDLQHDLVSYTNDQPIPPKDWQKQILHFSGGDNSSEQNSFRGYVYRYGQIATDTLWGTDTTAYSKTTSTPIYQSLSEIIKDRINQGVSWITFFGHSATGAFDFSIDEPEHYNNSPKFPIILSNGCYSGFIHDVDSGYSERFVMVPDKGAIAFMATSSLSLANGLDNFSTQIYNNVCKNDYMQPLGKSFQQAYNYINKNYSNDDGSVGVAYEMTLDGDPGLMPNQYPKPDYAIDETSVFFTPANVTPGLDSFQVNVVVTNLGRAIKDTFAVSLKRTYFDANQAPVYTIYRKIVPTPYYKDTVTFNLPVNISNLGYGQNFFDALVDADHQIDEMAECNNGIDAGCAGSTNTHSASILIQSDDIIPIYPYEFAIVPSDTVTLKSSTVNPFAPYRAYHIEVDTSELFAHPLKDTILYHSGGVVPWTVHLPLPFNKDSSVYYWRIAKDSIGAAWHYSSFIYLKNEYPGWNQSHYFQWKKDNYLNVNIDSTDRVFKFPPTVNNIHVETGISNAVGGNIDASNLEWSLNNVLMYDFRMGGCDNWYRGITFAVIDPITGPWISYNYQGSNSGQFGNIHCASHPEPQYGFDFGTNGNSAPPWANYIRNFINAIPNGDYVLVYSTNNPDYSQWDPILVTALSSIGFTEASQFKNGTLTGPFIFFNRKGYTDTTLVTAPSGNYNIPIQASINFNATWNQGNFSSPLIGPAVQWGSVHWQHVAMENPTYDKDTLDIIGVRNSGVQQVLLSTVQPDNIFNGSISADTFPYLKLQLRTRDDSVQTPTQLKYWRVLYKKPPEAAINPSKWFRLVNDTSNIGQTFHLEIGLENVTDVPMDSMLTKYTVRDAALSIRNSYIRYSPLRALDTLHLFFDAPLNSSTFSGINKVILEANPNNDQIEQYHFNNFAEINFTGTGDKINPLLDVTFDNQHILDGDIVSAKPDILISLKDENKYLALNNPDFVDVYLKYPNQTTPQKIIYDGSTLTFYPANSSNLQNQNKAVVEFKPVLPVDGTYELLVNDRDSSGNISSTVARNEGNVFYNYKITFQVINKPMITNVLNYPNPFTTATKFIFTITGSEVPDIMKIQIMTIKGTVVKEITKEELGDMHIGQNISQYTWDGRDQYGDLLANGVYFYRVVARLDDKQMDHFSQNYDKYFKKGFGKLVIIR